MERPQRSEPPGELVRVARERRAQVLDEVDLVHVTPRDRGSHLLDREHVLRGCPRLFPRAELEAPARARSPGERNLQAASGSAAHGSAGGGVLVRRIVWERP